MISIPVLQIEDFLFATINVDLDDASMAKFQDDLLHKVVQTEPQGVVIDISAIDAIDSFNARTLNDLAVAIHLLGALLVIVGIQPSAAVTLVQMGLTIPNAITAVSLKQGLEKARRQIASAQAETRPSGLDGARIVQGGKAQQPR